MTRYGTLSPIPGPLDLSPGETSPFLQRYMVGVDAPLQIQWKNPAPLTHANVANYHRQLDVWMRELADCTETPYDNKKETLMIDKKDYVAQAVKTPVASLAQRHIGSLVTITLPSGAEITDVLIGVSSGRLRQRTLVGEHPGQDVEVKLANVGGAPTSSQILGDLRAVAHILGPKSVVLVRRPKPETAAKKKSPRR